MFDTTKYRHKYRAPFCELCGARDGHRHQDEQYSRLVVHLRYSKERKRLECQVCVEGIEQAIADGTWKDSEGREMTMTKRISCGRVCKQAYVAKLKLPPIEAKQHYTITDCIVDLMHYANSRGFNAEMIVDSALNHFQRERREQH